MTSPAELMRLPVEPEWIDLPRRRRIRCAVNDTAAEALARARMYMLWQRVEDEALADREEVIAYAERAADAWEGFDVPGTGEPAPFSPAHLRAVLETWPGVAVAFRDALNVRRQRLQDEKKDSAPSSAGTGTATPAAPSPPAPGSAAAAPTPASPAPGTGPGNANTSGGPA